MVVPKRRTILALALFLAGCPARSTVSTADGESPRLPEDPIAAKEAEIEWDIHLAMEERERKLGYDRRKLKDHQVVFAFVKNTRARYDLATTAPAVSKIRADLPPSLAEIRRRIALIDHWGVNSNLLEDYAVMLEMLADDYPRARVGSLQGAPGALDALRAKWDHREKKIAGWLAEAATAEDD